MYPLASYLAPCVANLVYFKSVVLSTILRNPFYAPQEACKFVKNVSSVSSVNDPLLVLGCFSKVYLVTSVSYYLLFFEYFKFRKKCVAMWVLWVWWVVSWRWANSCCDLRFAWFFAQVCAQCGCCPHCDRYYYSPPTVAFPFWDSGGFTSAVFVKEFCEIWLDAVLHNMGLGLSRMSQLCTVVHQPCRCRV